MAKTISGLFDDRTEAQNVMRELLDEGYAREDISMMAKEPETREKDKQVVVEYVEEEGREQVEDMAKGAGTGAAIGGAAGLLLGLTSLAIPGIGPVLAAGPLAAAIAGAGLGGSIGGLLSGLTRLGVGNDDAHSLAEGVRRGATLVSVNVPDKDTEMVIGLMKRHGAIEIDKRASQWREEGWRGFEDAAADLSRAAGFDASSEVTAEHQRLSVERRPTQGEIAVPVVEERLEVGKREVERGGVRVQTRVSQQPVEEEVELREEHVHVERRPADYTFHGGESDAFKESLVEIKEAYEELIVNKKAKVVEEVVVGKDVEQHTETVRDTLRRTDVDVERLEPERAQGAAAASSEEPQSRTEGRRERR